MRVLFVSQELIGSAICQRIVKEGHEVKLFINDTTRSSCLDGIVIKTHDWKKELPWVGKEGLIVFDDVGYGEIQDKLRAEGYRVVGGSTLGDKLEEDRGFCQQILHSAGLRILPSFNFSDAKKAREFVEENSGVWVVKQSGHVGMLNYVGQDPKGRDVIGLLKVYEELGIAPIHLQKRAYGVEIGIARYFNGHDWVGPIEFNLEHKHLHNGRIGPMTGEMGTVMWHEANEDHPLFVATLANLKPFLQQANYKGDIDINTIVSEEEVWPLEATARFGKPAAELHCELYTSPFHDFFGAIADGSDHDLSYKKGYGIAITVAVPPFPYPPSLVDKRHMKEGVFILFKDSLTETDLDHIHYEEVSRMKLQGDHLLYHSSTHGYVLYVTEHGASLHEAREKAYAIIDKLIIPKMSYRTDIGLEFEQQEQAYLKKWGWLT